MTNPEESLKKYYQVVFVLGSEIERREPEQKWVPAEVDKRGRALGGEWRVRAAAQLIQEQQTNKIVFVGGAAVKETGNPDTDLLRPTVMRDCLINDYQVVPEKVYSEKTPPSTAGNVLGVYHYIARHPELHVEGCAFLTNFYHIPRAMRFFQHYGLNLKPIIAESLFAKNPEELKKIKEFYVSSEMWERIQSELEGAYDWEVGNYTIRFSGEPFTPKEKEE